MDKCHRILSKRPILRYHIVDSIQLNSNLPAQNYVLDYNKCQWETLLQSFVLFELGEWKAEISDSIKFKKVDIIARWFLSIRRISKTNIKSDSFHTLQQLGNLNTMPDDFYPSKMLVNPKYCLMVSIHWKVI